MFELAVLIAGLTVMLLRDLNVITLPHTVSTVITVACLLAAVTAAVRYAIQRDLSRRERSLPAHARDRA